MPAAFASLPKSLWLFNEMILKIVTGSPVRPLNLKCLHQSRLVCFKFYLNRCLHVYLSADCGGHLHEIGWRKVFVGERPEQTHCQVFFCWWLVLGHQDDVYLRRCISAGWISLLSYTENWRLNCPSLKVVLCPCWCFWEWLCRRTIARGMILEQALLLFIINPLGF